MNSSQGLLASAREVALAAVSEAFSRNEVQPLDEYRSRNGGAARQPPRRGRQAYRPGQKRSPEELAALVEREFFLQFKLRRVRPGRLGGKISSNPR